MKTSQLYIEQVLIGGLIILIAALPWLPEVMQVDLKDVNTVAGLAGGSLVAATAFWLGIPFDRFSDTLLDRLNRHNRLNFVLGHARDTVSVSGERLISRKPFFAEDKARIAALREGGAVVEWVNYHASRIRLTRAVAAFGPALTLTLTIGLTRWLDVSPMPDRSLLWTGGALLGLAYGIWALSSPAKKEDFPREDEPEFFHYAKRVKWVSDQGIAETRRSDLRLWRLEDRLLLGPGLLVAASLGLAIWSCSAQVLAAAVASTILTILSAWSWWRIMYVYRTYLRDFERLPRAK